MVTIHYTVLLKGWKLRIERKEDIKEEEEKGEIKDKEAEKEEASEGEEREQVERKEEKEEEDRGRDVGGEELRKIKKWRMEDGGKREERSLIKPMVTGMGQTPCAQRFRHS